MRKIVIATLTAIPLVAVGAYAFAQPAAPTANDDLFLTPPKVGAMPAGEAGSDEGVVGKKLTIGDFAMESEHGEHGESGEGPEDND